MESNHCTKTPGGGVTLTLSSATIPESPALSPCQHINGKGHRCHMFTADPGSTLCAHHVRKQLKAHRRQNEAAANELLDNVGDFTSAGSVNAFLGNLVKQLAHKRITRRDAVAFAYISQLLLNSVSALDREHRAEEAEDDAQTSRLLLSLFHKRDNEDNPATTDRQAQDTDNHGTSHPNGRTPVVNRSC
jgi:hypothetical protein